MAFSHLFLDKRVKRDDGTFPIKLAICQNGKTAMLNIGVYAREEHWDKKKRIVIGTPNKMQLNSGLARMKMKVDEILMRLFNEGKLQGISCSKVVGLVKNELNPPPVVTFLDYYKKFMESRRSPRTRDIYYRTIVALAKHDARIQTRSFEEITPSYLNSFYNSMEKTSPSVNARNIHLRNIRAAFNSAIDDELTQYYPFRKVKIRYEQTRKRALSVEQLRQLFNADVPEWKKKWIDAFKLTFCLIGINTIDLFNAPPVVGDRLVYTRSKTSKFYEIKIEPEAREIIEKYKSKKHLMNCMDHITFYKHFAMRMNDNVKSVMPGVTSYWARHTWASIAAELDIPKETIAHALGHSNSSVTDIYIDFNYKKVDEANRRVLDYVFNDIK